MNAPPVLHKPERSIKPPMLDVSPPCFDVPTPDTSLNLNSTSDFIQADVSATPITTAGVNSNASDFPMQDNINLDNIIPISNQETIPEPQLGGGQVDLEKIAILKEKYFKNPCIAYLNINSLRGNKFVQLKEMLNLVKPEILCIDETKLTPDFTTAQFHIDGYHYPPFRRDRTQNLNSTHFGGGKIVYIKEDLISDRLDKYETEHAETICLNLTIQERKWFIMFAYRPESIDRKLFFDEVNKSLSKVTKYYEHLIIAGDLNIDITAGTDRYNLLSELCGTYNLKNLVKGKTCNKSMEGSSIDVILTNKPGSFFHSNITETGLSDHHCMVSTLLRCHYEKLPPKNFVYRDKKNFNQINFVNDIKNIPISELNRFANPFTGYETLFKCIVDRHCPTKTRKVRGNDKPFMTKELSNAMKKRSRIINKYNKCKSRANYLEKQSIMRQCRFLQNKAKKAHFNKTLTDSNMTNKKYWALMRPFLTEKGGNYGTKITLKENENFITNEDAVAETFNDQYVNIVEKTTGSSPVSIPNTELDIANITETINKIIQHFSYHPSIKAIRENNQLIEPFHIPLAQISDIQDILKTINIKKSAGPGMILPSLVKMCSNVIDRPLTDIVNHIVVNCIFPDSAKIAHVTPIYKKNGRTDKSNYRPVSVIGTLPKILERYIHNKVNVHIDKCLSNLISAYRKHYSSNHVLIRLIEKWKKQMDDKMFVGAVLMDLSKAFDCVPHDLLIAKLHAYGFEMNTLILFYSYLKNRKQCVKINNVFSSFMVLVSGVPQGSILGPILFNIFINDLVYFIKSDLGNFADDNSISDAAKTIPDLINILENESNNAIEWFRGNDMIVNPEKFQAIIFNRRPKDENTYLLNFANKVIKTSPEVVLLGIEIDNNLKFKKHIHQLVKNAAGQLNFLSRQNKFLNHDAKRTAIESFVLANFNYCPLVWHFCSSESMKRLERIQERAFRLLLNDHESDYEQLFTKINKPTLEIRRLKFLATEIFKTINNLNPPYMKEIFELNTRRDNAESKLIVQSQRSMKYGSYTLRSLGPRIWNKLPVDIRKCNSLLNFKELLKTWSGPKCHCNSCKFVGMC